jgi:hypothetical protein
MAAGRWEWIEVGQESVLIRIGDDVPGLPAGSGDPRHARPIEYPGDRPSDVEIVEWRDHEVERHVTQRY